MDPLSVRLFENSVVCPTIRVASQPGKLLMGVYDGRGDYVEGSALDRRSGERGAPVPPTLFAEPTDAETPEAIYAGTLYYHFGHFLLESLARAWYAHRHPELPFVWAGEHTWHDRTLWPWQLEILDILGIDNPTRIVTRPLRFGQLHIPDIGYRYDDTFHPEHAEFLGRYVGPPQISGRRLWLSRSRAVNNVRDVNAAPTESRLSAAGWAIANPEVLTIREQLDHLSRAETVAGEEGSAFHTAILLKDLGGKKFEVFRRHGPEHRNMHTIGNARDIDQSFHTLERWRVLRADGRAVSKVTPNSSEVLDVLGIPVPPAPPASSVPQVDLIAALAIADLEPERVLDVGASSAHLLLGLSAPTRVAVSPRFAFDPRSYADTGIDFFELSLTQYAGLFHVGRRFDLIRISGDTFEEVMAAFHVSRRLSQRNTTWVLGSDELAARAALALRTGDLGFVVRKVSVEGAAVYVARRVPSRVRSEARVKRLSRAQVRRRARWVLPAGWELRARWNKGLTAVLGQDRADRVLDTERHARQRFADTVRPNPPKAVERARAATKRTARPGSTS